MVIVGGWGISKLKYQMLNQSFYLHFLFKKIEDGMKMKKG